jgi:hypothetical protein
MVMAGPIDAVRAIHNAFRQDINGWSELTRRIPVLAGAH